MKTHVLLSTMLLCASPLALAQQAEMATPGPYTHVTHIQATTGPVTVLWGQPELAKANEYHVQISDFDSNGDGRLSRKEIPANHALQFEFAVVDVNNDGYLDAAEMVSWR